MNVPLLQALVLEMVLDVDSPRRLYFAIRTLGGSGQEPSGKASEARLAENAPLLQILLIKIILDMDSPQRLYVAFNSLGGNAADAIKAAEAKRSLRALEKQRREQAVKDAKELLLKKLSQRRASMYPDSE